MMAEETVPRPKRRASTMKKVLITVGVLAVIGAVTGVGLLLAYPAPTMFAGAMAINFVKTLRAPVGTVGTELNPSYKAGEDAAPFAAEAIAGSV